MCIVILVLFYRSTCAFLYLTIYSNTVALTQVMAAILFNAGLAVELRQLTSNAAKVATGVSLMTLLIRCGARTNIFIAISLPAGFFNCLLTMLSFHFGLSCCRRFLHLVNVTCFVHAILVSCSPPMQQNYPVAVTLSAELVRQALTPGSMLLYYVRDIDTTYPPTQVRWQCRSIQYLHTIDRNTRLSLPSEDLIEYNRLFSAPSLEMCFSNIFSLPPMRRCMRRGVRTAGIGTTAMRSIHQLRCMF